MRNYLLQQYTEIHPKGTIIGHHSSVHFKNFFVSLGIIALLWGLYELSIYFFPSIARLHRIAIAGVMITYGHFLIRFLDLYLDALIIDENGVTVFLWNKIFNYSIHQSHRDHIEDIQQSQRTIADKIFVKGNITFTLNNGKVVRFDHLAHPKKIASMLRDAKVHFETPNTFEQDNNNQNSLSHEKFDILVETLGEVIKDYMDKDKKDETNDR